MPVKYNEIEINENYITELIKNNTREDYHLEFKDKAYLTNSTNDNEIGHEVASMANSGGGIIIYGIRTVRGAQGMDSADSLTAFEISDNTTIQSVSAKLMSRIDRPITKLQIEEIHLSDLKKWVIVVAVPNSEFSPHMFVHKPKDNLKYSNKYFMRTGNGDNIPMNGHEVRLRMLAQQISTIIFEAEYKFISANQLNVHFHITNNGRAVIENPCIKLFMNLKKAYNRYGSHPWNNVGTGYSKIHYIELRQNKVYSSPLYYPNSREELPILYLDDIDSKEFKNKEIKILVEIHGKGMESFYGHIIFTPEKGKELKAMPFREYNFSTYNSEFEKLKKEVENQ